MKSLPAKDALAHVPALKEPRLIDDWVFWLEQRPGEGGRTTALVRPWHCSDVLPQELTPSPINLRTRVHGYGGGAVATASKNNHFFMAWIDDMDGCLWLQVWKDLNFQSKNTNNFLEAIDAPIRLSSGEGYLLADGLIDLDRMRWIGVMELSGKDYLVTFSLEETDQAPKVIHKPLDFIGYAALSSDGNKLAWVEWQNSDMPWDSSQLWWSKIDSKGNLIDPILLIGNSDSDQNRKVSVFQPTWLPSGKLVIAEDSTGWWNLIVTDPEKEGDIWQRPWPMRAECGMPQWVYGMSTYSTFGERIIASICREGSWSLHLLDLDGTITPFPQPFDDIAGVKAQLGRAVALASNSFHHTVILELDLNLVNYKYSKISNLVLNKEEISVAERFWFSGFNDQLTQAWLYPPQHGFKGPAPLLVKSHSGPTSMASKGLNLGIQFWTSRGWCVVDVNYGGSTGFGRSYRERLKYGWGKVDVFDCEAAAKVLIKEGKADPRWIAIEGGSAGGFTTLSCLCFSDIFRAGACRYAVSDLISMAKQTHRFERNYLNHLIGPLSKYQKRYEKRSPLNSANKIQCPVIFFQGLDDDVVPLSQSVSMANALRNNNIDVKLLTFPGEGHGFRNSTVKIQVLEETERFFRQHLCL